MDPGMSVVLEDLFWAQLNFISGCYSGQLAGLDLMEL